METCEELINHSVLTEGEIKVLKRRINAMARSNAMSKIDKAENLLYEINERGEKRQYLVTEEQSKKGLDYLKKILFTKYGFPNKFARENTYVEDRDIVNNPGKFYFAGFYYDISPIGILVLRNPIYILTRNDDDFKSLWYTLGDDHKFRIVWREGYDVK